MRKQVLVTVDREETRVAMLEAEGDPAPSTPSSAKEGRPTSRRRKRGEVPAGYRAAEIYFERRGARSIVGNIYKGKVDNVLPGLEAAFVDFGLDKNGFLHVDEIVLPGVETAKRGRGASGPRISDLLAPGQEIVVQVIKDPLKTKGARLSMELTIAGRYMVYAPTGEGVGVSRRLEDKERDRLRKEAKQLDLHGGGAIIRTAAQGATRADFERELQYLAKLTEVLRQREAEAVAPALVFQEADLSVRVVRDIFSAHFERAVVDDPKQHQRLTSFFARTAPELVDRVELYEDPETPLFDAYGVQPVIEGILSKRVDLPSGGYLIIDYAEALTVIDVNSGSFTGKGKSARLEDTITKTNLEAAEEVVRQLRLRDIGGIIVIDFIDMARARNRDAVLKTLRKALDEDRTKTFVVEISPLGLVEMTRQNVTDGVREIMTKACPTCAGEGVVKSEETLAIDAERRLRRLVAELGADAPEAFLVRLNPRVTASFIGDGARMLRELEAATGRWFHFEGSEGLPLDHFAITLEGTREQVAEQAVPFREGDEVHVDIVEPHMYNVDDAVAKVDGYIISVTNGGPFVGEKKLVRIEDAGRTAAVASLLGAEADAARDAAEVRRKADARNRARRATTARRRAEASVPEPAETAEAVALAEAPGVTGLEPADGDEGTAATEAAGPGTEAAPVERVNGRRRGRRGRGGGGGGTAGTDAEGSSGDGAEGLALGAEGLDGGPPEGLALRAEGLALRAEGLAGGSVELDEGAAPAISASDPREVAEDGADDFAVGGSEASGESESEAVLGEMPARERDPEGPEGLTPGLSGGTDGLPTVEPGGSEDGEEDAVDSPGRRRGRRGGRRRSRASSAVADPAESEASE